MPWRAWHRHDGAERVRGAVHEVGPVAAVDVQVDEPRREVHPAEVDPAVAPRRPPRCARSRRRQLAPGTSRSGSTSVAFVKTVTAISFPRVYPTHVSRAGRSRPARVVQHLCPHVGGRVMARRKLNGLRVLVTGASQGIGRALVVEAAKHGCKVLAAARSQPLLDELAAEVATFGGAVEDGRRGRDEPRRPRGDGRRRDAALRRSRRAHQQRRHRRDRALHGLASRTCCGRSSRRTSSA